MKFKYPFQGKRKPVTLYSVFLLEPEFFLKFQGAPFSTVMNEMGEESLFKRIQNISNKANPIKLINEIFKRFFLAEIDSFRALMTSQDSDIESSQNKLYKYFFAGMFNKSDFKLTYRASFILDVEDQISSADLLFKQKKYQEAVESLISQPISQHIIWSEALQILQSRKSYKELTALRYSMALEMLVSILAAMDVNLSAQHELSSPVFLDVIPTNASGDKNPTSLLFHAFKKEMNAVSINDLMKLSSNYTLSETNIKRWSNGTYLPQYKNYIAILDANFKGATHQKLQGKFLATKMINFIGYAVQHFQEVSEEAITKNDIDAILPFPRLPFGHLTIQDWLEERYPYWINYHQQEINRRGCFPS